MPVALRVLGLIPARGGSKGVPGKNVRPLGGRPLLTYTIDSARESHRLTRTILSTDDPVIADVGLDAGVEVPFLRPPELAQDDTPTLAVVIHALGSLGAASFDAVCILQPTSPLRAPGLIDRCIELLDTSGADAVMTVVEVPHEHNPHWVWFGDDDGHLHLATGEREPLPRRQLLPPAFCRDGSVYVTRRSVLESGSLYGGTVRGIVVDGKSTVNIDDLEDWERAEQLLGRTPST